MNRRRMAVVASSMLLAACLANIPELTGPTGAGGGATTVTTMAASTTTTGSSTATGWCDEQGAGIEFCADFDGGGGVGQGWDEVDDDSMGAHAELAEDPVASSPRSAHIWVDATASGCTYAQLRTSVPEPMGQPPLSLRFEHAPTAEGIAAELKWRRGASTCIIYLYVRDATVALSFREDTQAIQSGFRYSAEVSPLLSLGELSVQVDREMRQFGVSYEGLPLTVDLEYAGNDAWYAACVEPAPEGDLELAIGSVCVGPGSDELTDAYFDNVVLDFQ